MPQGNATAADTFSITFENGRVVKRFPERSKPVIGLALSGGGSRGIAHIGVIEVLEKAGIRVERISGTSMGSVIGGLYASGYSPQVISSIFQENDLSDILSSNPRRRNVYIGQKDVTRWPLFDIRFQGFRAQLLPTSFSTGQKLSTILSWLLLGPTYECGCNFDLLPIPFRAVATNCISGNATVLGSGNLARAIQASSTIPGLFAPVEWGDTLLIDGGLTNNLPVNVAREMGSDLVIAAAIEESMHPREELDNPINMADQVTSIPMRNVTALSLRMADFVISPDMTDFSSKDFSHIEEMIERGRKAATDSLPSLLEMISRATVTYRKTTVRSVTIEPSEEQPFVSAVFEDHISAESLTAYSQIVAGVEELWYSGRYCSVIADFEEQSSSLRIRVRRTPQWVTVQSKDTEGDSDETDIFSTDNDGQYSMQALIERMDDLIRVIRSDRSGSTLASITGQQLSATGDTLHVTVTLPRLTGVFIEPTVKTRKTVVTREVEMETGDVFDLRRALESVENLYGTNLFEHVSVDIFPHLGGVGYRIHLKERDWTVVRLGLNYTEFSGTEGRVGLSRENIFGFGNQINATVQSGRRTRMIMAENRNDRIFRSLYTFNIRAYRHERLRPIYDRHTLTSDYVDNRYGFILSIGQVMDKLGNVVLQFKSETSKLDYPRVTERKDTRHEFRSIVIRSLVDTYDRYPFPRQGMLNTVYVENASKVFGGTEQFVKIFWGATAYRTLARRHTFSSSLFLGSADPSTPESESFFLGGVGSRLNCLNSPTAASLFHADFMGLRSEQHSGTRLAAIKGSYRLFIPRYFYLDFSVGAGNVWKPSDTITADSLLHFYGVTGTFDTYLGPLSIGWGITSRGDDRLYMSAGREF